ncbi:MAG TPA: hypothetical protein VLH60_04025 [Sedimentisphaerales bacterium]|nr:hypothetical protein [Sedimentisphaerales bacterium]
MIMKLSTNPREQRKPGKNPPGSDHGERGPPFLSRGTWFAGRGAGYEVMGARKSVRGWDRTAAASADSGRSSSPRVPPMQP